MATYYIRDGFLGMGEPICVEYDGPPPCLFCGEPVPIGHHGTDGPLVCGPCDMGCNPDGSAWTRDQAEERWRHRIEAVERYRGNDSKNNVTDERNNT